MAPARAHIALVAPPLRGHLDPLGVLGQELAARGHHVTLLTDREGSGWVPEEVNHHVLAVPASMAGLAETMAGTGGGYGALSTIIAAMARRTDALCALLPPTLSAMEPDLVIVDQTEPAGALAARGLGLRFAGFAAALPLDRDESIPPPYLGWRWRQNRTWLYRGGYRVTDWLMRPVTEVLNRHAPRFGLPPIARMEDLHADGLQIAQIWPKLDYPRGGQPASLQGVGPLRGSDEGIFAMGADLRPLVFCSLGSLQGGRADIFAAVARAAQKLDLRLVLAHGGRLTDEQVRELPGSPLVRAFVPQRAVLAKASMAVLHGGMNSVLDALSKAVPAVVMPIAFDQAAIAARVDWRGAGLVVKPSRMERDLEGAMRALRDDTRFKHAAQLLATEARAAGGVSRAADLVERQLGFGRQRPASVTAEAQSSTRTDDSAGDT